MGHILKLQSPYGSCSIYGPHVIHTPEMILSPGSRITYACGYVRKKERFSAGEPYTVRTLYSNCSTCIRYGPHVIYTIQLERLLQVIAI